MTLIQQDVSVCPFPSLFPSPSPPSPLSFLRFLYHSTLSHNDTPTISVNSENPLYRIYNTALIYLFIETQIKGRTARQGDTGSFSMVLNENELELYMKMEKIDSLRKTKDIYESLNTHREDYVKRNYASRFVDVSAIVEKHRHSMDFVDRLRLNQRDEVVKFLTEMNRSTLVEVEARSSRTMVLMDATGSMSGLLVKTKQQVLEMFQRAVSILTEEKLVASFEVQFVVYRDYDCTFDRLLQCSEWENNPESLATFMARCPAEGGGSAEEAVEVGLWHANQQMIKLKDSLQPLSSVILIGDDAANPRELIDTSRAIRGESYWRGTEFRDIVFYRTEAEKLKSAGIPVDCFYVRTAAEKTFREIANITGGECAFLDVNSAQGATILVNMITKKILQDAAGGRHTDLAVKLIEAYDKGYSRA